MSFDLNNLTLADTATLHLEHPSTGMPMYDDEAEKKPVEIIVYGRSSKQYRNWLAAANRQKQQRGKKNISTEAELAETVEFLVAVTKEVRNLRIGDVEINSPDTFKLMYSNLALSWIADQVANTLSEIDGFLQK